MPHGKTTHNNIPFRVNETLVTQYVTGLGFLKLLGRAGRGWKKMEHPIYNK